MTKLYLDTSVIVKRYIVEKGSEQVSKIYLKSDAREIDICFSIWNLGEAIGVIDQYQRRGWITDDQFKTTISSLAGETVRLMKIDALELLPITSSGLAQTLDLIKRYHLYQADAMQIIGCALSKADMLVSADRGLLEIAEREGIASANIEDLREIPES